MAARDRCVARDLALSEAVPRHRSRFAVGRGDDRDLRWLARIQGIAEELHAAADLAVALAVAGAQTRISALKDQRNGRIDAVAIANLGCGPGDLDRLAHRRSGWLGLGHTHGDWTGGIA